MKLVVPRIGFAVVDLPAAWLDDRAGAQRPAWGMIFLDAASIRPRLSSSGNSPSTMSKTRTSADGAGPKCSDVVFATYGRRRIDGGF